MKKETRKQRLAPASKLFNSSRRTLTVYLVLRALVLLTLVIEVLAGRYENVYICVLALILFIVPSILERQLRVELPDALQIVILCFIFASTICGEIREYYLTVPHWDTALHTINGFLFAAIGFSMVDLLNRNKRVSLTLSPFYMAVMAFCFSMTIGVLWEFFEWGMDSLFLVDMQKDAVLNAIHTVDLDPNGHNFVQHVTGVQDVILVLEDGTTRTLALGGYLDIGLQDTMKDLLVNFIGAVVFCVFGYFYVKSRGKGKIAKMFIPSVLPEEETKE